MNVDLDRITSAGRTPHGYTLAMWAAGMFCISRRGLPGVADVLMFTVGATVAFGVLRLAVVRWGLSRTPAAPEHTAALSSLASVHMLALPGAVLVSWLLAALPAPWCWLATSSGATVAFIVLHGGQDVLFRRWGPRAA
ncbi:hypothetical protein ACXPWS_16240 [Mycobacterium sp. BMJ-28]